MSVAKREEAENQEPPSYDSVAVNYEPTGYGGYYNPAPLPGAAFPGPSTPPILPEPQNHSSVTAGGLRLDKAYLAGDRLTIDFEKHACCPWETVGLDPDCKNYIPPELAARGISQSQWEEWCDDLMKNQKRSPSISGCLCLFCFPGFLLQSIILATFCPISANHPLKCLPCCYGDWHHGLDKWQRKVNKVLNPLDMHAKLKTFKPHGRAPQSLNKATRVAGKDENYEMGMLIIALNATESQKLMGEPWDNGVNDGCTSGIGRFM